MRQLKPNVFSVGAIDWERRLFDELIPLPDGTTYNSYLIKGSEKSALIDTVDFSKTEDLMSHLIDTGADRIDYIISNHAEQDHSGSIPDMLLLHPEAKVVTNPKCRQMLIDHLHIEEDRFITVEDGQILSLGDKTLQFIYTPWVHWPETMSTFLQEDGILFSCDFFGSHLASSHLFVQDEAKVLQDAKRYYAEIMMPFRSAITGNLKKLADLKIEMIAPSHGPVYNRPALIVDAYHEWVEAEPGNKVTLAYVSMHESTRKMVDHFTEALMEREIEVERFDLTHADLGELAMSLVDSATVVIGSPTVLVGPHPMAAYAATLINALRPKAKYLTVIGSYGWAGKMPDQLQQILSGLKAEFLEPVVVKGLAHDENYTELDALADRILAKHKNAGMAA
ncbi:MAG: FprA family A-type flavoprotein [Sedimentisphaerales bacterium]|nr:FprA family A-type flavoprotein [Sedimentisphaerales bacterium]